MATILIVDDEYVIADILGYALEDEGYTVVKAGNGRKGLEILERDRPTLVITDFMMPLMDGLEFARAIRERPAFEQTPIVLMSGAQANLGRDNPHIFAAVFDKPFDIDKVIAKVSELLGEETH
ncbi:response regulator [Pseudomonas sp. HR96]|uniref:response regulator n=1 Tax=Pseudomonas sp. HR96 TaxID=1027966 RepID=UPI002A76356E|nr:response regulator [Pseudomonas sp. HR96]WPO98006.1 response regulator [Pseudomonas sp. HR96]